MTDKKQSGQVTRLGEPFAGEESAILREGEPTSAILRDALTQAHRLQSASGSFCVACGLVKNNWEHTPECLGPNRAFKKSVAHTEVQGSDDPRYPAYEKRSNAAAIFEAVIEAGKDGGEDRHPQQCACEECVYAAWTQIISFAELARARAFQTVRDHPDRSFHYIAAIAHPDREFQYTAAIKIIAHASFLAFGRGKESGK